MNNPRASRPIPIGLTALVAFVSALAALALSNGMTMAQAHGHQPHPMGSPAMGRKSSDTIFQPPTICSTPGLEPTRGPTLSAGRIDHAQPLLQGDPSAERGAHGLHALEDLVCDIADGEDRTATLAAWGGEAEVEWV